jgi:hypothetical protein
MNQTRSRDTTRSADGADEFATGSQDSAESQTTDSHASQSQVTDENQSDSDTPSTTKKKGLRAKVAGLRARASIQDRLLEKSVSYVSIIPPIYHANLSLLPQRPTMLTVVPSTGCSSR